MSEFNIEQLKDFDFNIPESWIENALIVPPEKRKPAVPVMFYRYAASAAACVILAAAVTFSLIFGINKDVDLTDPDYGSEKTSAVERTTGDASSTDPSGEGTVIGNIPWIFGGDSESSTFVTEPAETDADGNKTNNRSSKSKQRASTPSNGSTKPSSQNSGNPNGSSSEQGATDPGNSYDETAEPEPATAEPWLPPPIEEPTEYWPEPWEPWTDEPWFVEPTTQKPEQPELRLHFSIYAKLASEDDVVYCKVTNKDGNVVSNGSANIKFYGSGYSLVSYTTYQKAGIGDQFTVCFYRADGGVYTTQTITTREINNFTLGYYKKAKY